MAIGDKAHVNFSLDLMFTAPSPSRSDQSMGQVLTLSSGPRTQVEHCHIRRSVAHLERSARSADAFNGPPSTRASTRLIRRLQTFAEFAKVDIVVDDDVQVTVTQFMRGVPWDLALEHVARKYNLRLIRTGKLIRVAKQ
jgi:hypothetical protein